MMIQTKTKQDNNSHLAKRQIVELNKNRINLLPNNRKSTNDVMYRQVQVPMGTSHRFGIGSLHILL